jgi:hypothetical protein
VFFHNPKLLLFKAKNTISCGSFSLPTRHMVSTHNPRPHLAIVLKSSLLAPLRATCRLGFTASFSFSLSLFIFFPKVIGIDWKSLEKLAIEHIFHPRLRPPPCCVSFMSEKNSMVGFRRISADKLVSPNRPQTTQAGGVCRAATNFARAAGTLRHGHPFDPRATKLS